MDEILVTLKDIQRRVAAIEQCVATPDVDRILSKTHYSCREVAELTQRYGTKKAKEFTVRYACSKGRIPEAEKFDDGIWRIPREAVQRILNIGLPPERRKHN